MALEQPLLIWEGFPQERFCVNFTHSAKVLLLSQVSMLDKKTWIAIRAIHPKCVQ